MSRISELIDLLDALVSRGLDVKILAGNFSDLNFRRLCRKFGISKELEHYLYSGIDQGDVIADFLRRRRSSDRYFDDVNLLSFSAATIVGATDSVGHKHFFSNDNSLVSEWRRGCFDVSPVRDSSKSVIGYSFTDERTVHVSCSEFWMETDNKFWGVQRSESLERFLGANIKDVLASDFLHEYFKATLRSNRIVFPFDQNLLRALLGDIRYNLAINSIFHADLIVDTEVCEVLGFTRSGLGEYVDGSLQTVFDLDNSNRLMFKKMSTDKSSRASVYPLNGTCFAVISAAAAEIDSRGLSDDLSQRPFVRI